MECFTSQDLRSYSFYFDRFGYLISGPKSYQDLGETGPRIQNPWICNQTGMVFLNFGFISVAK